MRDSIVKFMEKFEYPDEAISSLCSAFSKIEACLEAYAVFRGYFDTYINEGKIPEYREMLRRVGEAGELAGVHKFASEFLVCIAMAWNSKKYYAEKGLSDEVWEDSMLDFKWKLFECYKVYGIWGSFVAFWFDRWFFATRAAFGRLQFELYNARHEHNGEKFNVAVGDKVVNVHIPSDFTRPLSKENCDAAYEQARKYYKQFFGTAPVLFMCESWMLLPEHKDILPEGTNIRRFMEEYELGVFIERDGDLWRIFGRPNSECKNYSTLPEDTSLRRIYKKYLLGGGRIGECIGYKY